MYACKIIVSLRYADSGNNVRRWYTCNYSLALIGISCGGNAGYYRRFDRG